MVCQTEIKKINYDSWNFHNFFRRLILPSKSTGDPIITIPELSQIPYPSRSATAKQIKCLKEYWSLKFTEPKTKKINPYSAFIVQLNYEQLRVVYSLICSKFICPKIIPDVKMSSRKCQTNVRNYLHFPRERRWLVKESRSNSSERERSEMEENELAGETDRMVRRRRAGGGIRWGVEEREGQGIWERIIGFLWIRWTHLPRTWVWWPRFFFFFFFFLNCQNFLILKKNC